MKNISVHIKKGEKTTFTFKKPIATYGTRIAAKEVVMYGPFSIILNKRPPSDPKISGVRVNH